MKVAILLVETGEDVTLLVGKNVVKVKLTCRLFTGRCGQVMKLYTPVQELCGQVKVVYRLSQGEVWAGEVHCIHIGGDLTAV